MNASLFNDFESLYLNDSLEALSSEIDCKSAIRDYLVVKVGSLSFEEIRSPLWLSFDDDFYRLDVEIRKLLSIKKSIRKILYFDVNENVNSFEFKENKECSFTSNEVNNAVIDLR